jgi:23S rRNA (cytosine1962-C5)-methyltransferase
MVILDPPAFTKSKANIAQAKRGYSEINRQALKLINTGGFLVSASCSHHITEEILMKIIHDEGVRINRKLKLIYRGMQSPCHPIYLPMPETQYLKFFVFEVW